MNRCRLSVLAFCLVPLAPLLPAAAHPPRSEWRRVAAPPHTEHLTIPHGGVLRLKHSTGELTIEGWDGPDVQLTTLKSTKATFPPDEVARAQARLDRVRVTTSPRNNELLIDTQFPAERSLPGIARVHGKPTGFDLEYRILVPRQTSLVVDHNEGEVHIADVNGRIQVRNRQGLIAVHLLEEGNYDIGARATAGSINSDFPGRETRKRFLGHSFLRIGTAKQKLDLRIGYGDIVILRMDNSHLPAEPAPAGAR